MFKKVELFVVTAMLAGVACAAIPDAASDDAFVEGTGTQFVNLRHRKSPNTRVWLDFRPTTMDLNTSFLGTEAGGGSSDATWGCMYSDSNGYYYFKHGDSAYWSRVQDATGKSYAHDLERHTMEMIFNADGQGGSRFIFTTGGETNVDTRVEASKAPNTKTNKFAMALFGLMGNYANGLRGNKLSKLRVYGVKIWEAGTLVHDYVPRRVGGLYYLKDLVDGAYVTSDPLSVTDTTSTVEPLAGGGKNIDDWGDGYLESDGQQWIDLGFKGNPNMKAELDYSFVSAVTAEKYLFGCSSSMSGYFTFMGFTSGAAEAKLGYGSESDKTTWSYFTSMAEKIYAGIKRSTARRTLVLDPSQDCVAYLTAGFTNTFVSPLPNAHATGETRRNCYLFTAPNDSGPRTTSAAEIKFYGLKLYENGSLVKNYVPCVKNGLAGILDTVGGTEFRSNSASLTNNPFVVVGGNIQMAAGENDLYVESDGSQHLNLGYKATANTRVEMDFSTKIPFVNGTLFLFGARENGLSYWAASDKHRFGFTVDNGSSNWSGLNESNGKINLGRYKLVMDVPSNLITCTQGGDTVFTCAANADTTKFANGKSNLDMYLFAVNKANVAMMKSSLRVYSFKIYESGVLQHAFYPHMEGGVVGLKDSVTGAFKTDVSGSSSPLVMRGCSVDGTDLALTQRPANSYVLASGASRVVSVAAPYANRYVWRKNGKVIEGESGASYALAWEKSETPVVYSVAPVYTIRPTVGFADREVEVSPAVFSVVNGPKGSIMYLR